MKWGWVAAVGAALLLSEDKSSPLPMPSPGPDPGKSPKPRQRAELVDAVIEAIGWDPAEPSKRWVMALTIWIAHSESGWRRSSRNRSAAERAAALQAYQRLVDEGRWKCPQDPAVYGIGSGGWYGQLAPFTVHHLVDVPDVPKAIACNPERVWNDATLSTWSYLAQLVNTLARKADKRFPGWEPTLMQARSWYGTPGRTEDQIEAKREQYQDSIVAAGLPVSWLDVQPRDAGDWEIPGLEVVA